MPAPQPAFASASAAREFPASHPRHAIGATHQKPLQPIPNQVQALKTFASPHLALQFQDEPKTYYYLYARKATLPLDAQQLSFGTEPRGTSARSEETRSKQKRLSSR